MVDIVTLFGAVENEGSVLKVTVGQASGLPTGQAGGLSYVESKNGDVSFKGITPSRLGEFR